MVGGTSGKPQALSLTVSKEHLSMGWYFIMPFLKDKLDSGPHMVAVAEAQLLALSRSPHGGYTPAKHMVPPFSHNLRFNDCMGWQMSET